MAIVALAGQLQLLPAAIACAAEHAKPVSSHCGGMQQAGPAVSASHDAPVAPVCAAGLGCAPFPSALAAAPALSGFAAEAFAVPVHAVVTPPSFHASPVSPPPQA